MYLAGPNNSNFKDSNYERISINQFDNPPLFPIVCGVVIGKSDPRAVDSKLGHSRHVLNFTIRDSPSDVVNVACWGEEDRVNSICESFAISDVVQIKNPQIAIKQPGNAAEKFQPYTSSRYELVITKSSEIAVLDRGQAEHYKNLLHVPVQSLNDFSPLIAIVHNAENIKNSVINLLVAIKRIGNLQKFKSKEGRSFKKLEIEVFDHSHATFKILIWSNSTSSFILNHFTPKTLVFISDLKVGSSRYSKSLVGTATSTTIFTPDPNIPEARMLHQFVHTVCTDIDDTELPIRDDGSRIYIVGEIQNIIDENKISPFADVDGITFAFLSHFDIDSTKKLTSLRCPKCKRPVASGKRCVNANCEVGSGMKNLNAEEVLDLWVHFSDHSGTITRCSLTGPVAEELLDCNVAQILAMSETAKTQLKWQRLFELYKIEFKIPQGYAVLGNPVIRILSCALAKPVEVMQYYKTLM